MKKILLLIVIAVFASPAEARHYHRHHHKHVQQRIDFWPAFMQPTYSEDMRLKAHKSGYHAVESASGEIVAHPSGCPSTAFCGCGAVKRLQTVWGITVRNARSLWLAANWYRFPRSIPQPGTAAVRLHHVFILERHIQGDVWMVYDANSGGHATRIHERSIAGYTIVSPRGA